MNMHLIFSKVVTNRPPRPRPLGVGLALILMAVGCGVLCAADAPEGEAKAPPPRLTERDYLLEELRLAEELLQIEEKRAEQVKGAPEKVISARRSVISLKRQLAAYDERTKQPTPEQAAERKRRAEDDQRKAEERQREEQEQERRTQALKQELLSVLLDIAQKDADAKVRMSSVNSINRLQLESSIEPLSRIAVRDPDNDVRQLALQGILGFASVTSTTVLLPLYDELPDASQKIALITGLQEKVTVTNEWGQIQVIQTIPTNTVPKWIQIAKETPGRDLRRAAIQKLAQVPGENNTAELVAIYETCGDNEFKQAIVQYLGGRPDQTAARKLVTIAQSDPDPRSRQLAVDLIGQMPFGRNRSPGPPYRMPPAAPPPPPLPTIPR